MSTRERKYHFDNSYLEEPLQYGDIYLYQIGDAYCESGLEIPAHVQICHEISYIVSGSGVFYADGKAYPVRSGSLFLSPLGVDHKICSSRLTPLRYYYCGFKLRPGASKEYAELDRFFSTIKEPLSVTQHNNNIQTVFSLLFDELIIDDQSCKQKLIRMELEQLLLLTRRCYEKGTELQRKLQDNSNFKQNLVYNVIRYIDDNIFTMQKLTDISDYVGYSYSYVAQVFSSAVGMTLKSYYFEKKFEKAVELLEDSGNVAWVSETLGFDSIQSFSRFFKNHCGTPPSRYGKKPDGGARLAGAGSGGENI